MRFLSLSSKFDGGWIAEECDARVSAFVNLGGCDKVGVGKKVNDNGTMVGAGRKGNDVRWRGWEELGDGGGWLEGTR
ncbi:uncharacterized protein DS421_13g389530 [Arachis hypogaea]|nr:uncharacterized protein DS421_13g389530 [Arachis hypogaea]